MITIVLFFVYFISKLVIINCFYEGLYPKTLLLLSMIVQVAAVGVTFMEYLQAPILSRLVYSILVISATMDYAAKLRRESFPDKPCIDDSWQVLSLLLAFMISVLCILLEQRHTFLIVGVLQPIIGFFLLVKYAWDTKIIVPVTNSATSSQLGYDVQAMNNMRAQPRITSNIASNP